MPQFILIVISKISTEMFFFSAAMSLDWDRIYLIPDVDEQVEHSTLSIDSLLEKFTPLRVVHRKSPDEENFHDSKLQQLVCCILALDTDKWIDEDSSLKYQICFNDPEPSCHRRKLPN
jgi:hypothetical protein